MFAGVDKGGWAAEWTPPELSAFKPVVNRGNKTFAVHTSRNVIIYNKQRVKPADAPKEWTDLWDPKWKGKVGMDPPWRSIAVQGLVALWVKNGITDAAEKLKAIAVARSGANAPSAIVAPRALITARRVMS